MGRENLELFIHTFFRNIYSIDLGKFTRSGEESTMIQVSNLKLSTLLTILHHGCIQGVLKFLELLLPEHFHTDDSAEQERTPTMIYFWKFQTSKQFVLNLQGVPGNNFTKFDSVMNFLFREMTEAAVYRFLQKQVFLRISKNSYENTCADVSF